VSFEKTVHIFQQIHALAPVLTPETLVLLVVDDRVQTPLGLNYACVLLSQALLGGPTIQVGGGLDNSPDRPIFKKDTVTAQNCGWCREVGYDRLLAFRLAADGSLSLLLRLPS